MARNDRSLTATLGVAGPALAAAAAASAGQADAAPLGLIALDQTGSFFEATIGAGGAEFFTIDRFNPNDSVFWRHRENNLILRFDPPNLP